jgi:hypothetical protein
VPLSHLHPIDAMLSTDAIHQVGFACLGLTAGLAALWSP